MFTVKHIDQNGNEFVMECASFSVAKDEQGLTRLTTYDTPHRSGDYSGLWAGEAVSSYPMAAWHVFIMNRFGATIGDYHFNDFDFGSVELEMQPPIAA